MTVKEIANKIADWEMRAGESFTDYFMHDNVSDEDWGKWLVNKGHKERGEAILKSFKSHREKNQFCCQDQDFLYHVYLHPNFEQTTNWKNCIEYEILYDDLTNTDENLDKDVLLWSEFFIDNSVYLDQFHEFLQDE